MEKFFTVADAYHGGRGAYWENHWHNPYKRGSEHAKAWENGLNSARGEFTTMTWRQQQEIRKEAR